MDSKCPTGREKRVREAGERVTKDRDAESERSVLEPFSSAEALNCLHRPRWPSVLHRRTRVHAQTPIKTQPN